MLTAGVKKPGLFLCTMPYCFFPYFWYNNSRTPANAQKQNGQAAGRKGNNMTFTNTERREYREYADAAEWFCDQGDERMAVDALREAVRAAGFDDSILTDLELLWILNECKKSDFGYNAIGCKLPADPWFLRVIVRRFPEGKILSKKQVA